MFFDGEDLNYRVLVPMGLRETVSSSGVGESISSSEKSGWSRSGILLTSRSNFVELIVGLIGIELDLKMRWAMDMLLIVDPQAVERPIDYEKIDGRDGLSNFISVWLFAYSELTSKTSESLHSSFSTLVRAAGLMKVTFAWGTKQN